MTLLSYVRVVYKNLLWLILFPLLTAILVIFMTRNIKREYATSSSLYTGAASGYNLASPLEARMDYFSVNNAFDNMIAVIKSRETVTEVNLRLMAQHLSMSEPKPDVIGDEIFKKLPSIFPDTLIQQCRKMGDKELVYNYLLPFAMSSETNVISNILRADHPYYSVMGFNHALTVNRKNSSDMIEMIFRSEDPGISKMALDILTFVFIDQYRDIKGDETNSVATYFETQLASAKEALDDAENRLKEFMVQNRIINYYEQSKYVAETKENIDIEINELKMALAAARSSLAAIEVKMGQKADILNNNTQLLNIRDEISRLRVKLSRTEIYGTNDGPVDSLRTQIKKLEDQYKQLALTFYNNSYTLESTPQQDLLRSWLDKVLEVADVEGRMRVFEERKMEFNLQYDKFAPWGSTLARLEREVRVTEEQYLSVLHGLNQAKLQKQNLKFSNNLTVVDHAYLPLQPEKSKRMMLVILGFMGTLFTMLAYLAAREFFDNSLKTPKRAIKETKMKLIGALPFVPAKAGAVDVESVNYSMTQQCLSNLILETENSPSMKRVLVASNMKREGKTWFITQMQEGLNAMGRKTLILLPDTQDKEAIQCIKGDYMLYSVPDNFIDLTDLKGFGLNPEVRDSYDFVFVELPDQATHPAPIHLIHDVDLCIRVVNSGRVWSASDHNIVEIFDKAQPKKHLLLLNAVPVDSLEELVGTIPKNRSKLRQLVHDWLSQSLTPSRLKTY
ncbi:MAG: hypothetical protein LPK45_03510 [Bacteroidota bacterium]|nr:hypothetical protein [Bacteroidota bacterium]MDX5430118.1 hypothetical protein [Bacteroidota bacterium]MDX5468879.1 hypothetical protein [Bacteroidota bacterium]